MTKVLKGFYLFLFFLAIINHETQAQTITKKPIQNIPSQDIVNQWLEDDPFDFLEYYDQTSKEALAKELSTWSLPQNIEEKLLALTYPKYLDSSNNETGYGLDIELIEKEQLFQLIPYNKKLQAFNFNFKKSKVNQSLDVTYRISHPSQIKTIADRFSWANKPEKLITFLEQRLKNANKGMFEVNLKEVLSSFIKNYIGTFENCNKPNCFNASISSHFKDDFLPSKHLATSKLNEILKKDYIKVKLEYDKLRSGDLIAYYKHNQYNIAHTVIYIDDNIVFTKNGLSKLSSYAFQDINLTDQIYIGDTQYTFKNIYRRKQQCSTLYTKP